MIIGIVLAGGKSSRMRQDKANLQIPNSDLSLLESAKTLLQATGVDNVLVSGHGYDIPDLHQNIGPIGGIYSSFKHLKKKFVDAKGMLCFPVDMPNISAQALSLLHQSGCKSQSVCFYDESVLPLYLPISKEVEDKLNQAVLAERYSIYKLVHTLPHHALELPNQKELTNLNTPQEWQAWCAAESN